MKNDRTRVWRFWQTNFKGKGEMEKECWSDGQNLNKIIFGRSIASGEGESGGLCDFVVTIKIIVVVFFFILLRVFDSHSLIFLHFLSFFDWFYALGECMNVREYLVFSGLCEEGGGERDNDVCCSWELTKFWNSSNCFNIFNNILLFFFFTLTIFISN